jgi:hypothetical protein
MSLDIPSYVQHVYKKMLFKSYHPYIMRLLNLRIFKTTSSITCFDRYLSSSGVIKLFCGEIRRKNASTTVVVIVVLRNVFRLIVVLFCVMCIVCMLCLIVVPLPPGKTPFAS